MDVKINNLGFSYDRKNYVIDQFNVDIEDGDIVAILGSSGSGKSTLLRLITGLEIPSIGSIKINNEVMVDDKTFVDPENRKVGMVFQDYALFPHMTVYKNIGFGINKSTKTEKADRIDQVLNLVNLQEFKKRYPHELSGGQQQRVALARALAPSPRLLLLDEPFSNLDADLKNHIREELRTIIKQSKTTSIVVTHDKDDAKMMADKIIYLNEGKIERIEVLSKTHN